VREVWRERRLEVSRDARKFLVACESTRGEVRAAIMLEGGLETEAVVARRATSWTGGGLGGRGDVGVGCFEQGVLSRVF